MGTLGKAILRMVAAIIVMVPVGLLLGLYGETTNEFRERHFSPDVKTTVRLQQLRNELADCRKRTAPSRELDSRIRETERVIGELEKQLGIRRGIGGSRVAVRSQQSSPSCSFGETGDSATQIFRKSRTKTARPASRIVGESTRNEIHDGALVASLHRRARNGSEPYPTFSAKPN